jgi:hypothetical protein
MIRAVLKVFNPIIFLWNYFKYCAHLEIYKDAIKYTPYDFNKNDTKYF